MYERNLQVKINLKKKFFFFRYLLFYSRLCKEPNHIPLRCDEIEKGMELEMRKFIEEHVTEAMIRKCPRCTQV